MKKTIAVTLTLALTIVVGVVGCGDSGEPEGPAPHKPMPEADVRAMFKRTTEIDLPAEVKCIDGLSVKAHCELGDIVTESVFMVVEAPESFKAVLKEKLRSTSNKPEWVMTGDPPPAMPAWDLKKMEGMKVYTGKTARQDDGRYYKFSVAFDDRSPAVFVASGEIVPPPPPKKKP